MIRRILKIIRGFFYRNFFLGENFRRIEERQRIMGCQLDFLLGQTNRKTRRKWNRMLTRPKSPFYIGRIRNENEEEREFYN